MILDAFHRFSLALVKVQSYDMSVTDYNSRRQQLTIGFFSA
jgi:hypothetical protein